MYKIQKFVCDPAVNYIAIIWWHTMQRGGMSRIRLTFCPVAYAMEI